MVIQQDHLAKEFRPPAPHLGDYREAKAGGKSPPLSPATAAASTRRGVGGPHGPAKSGETTKRGGLTHDRAGARAGQGSAGNHRGAYAASPSRTGRRGRGRRGRG